MQNKTQKAAKDRLRKLNNDQLQIILEEHKLWLKTNGKEGKQAELSRTDLSNRNLSFANLERAILSASNLTNAKLINANLNKAILRKTLLIKANLNYAYLSGATLTSADLQNASCVKTMFEEALINKARFDGAELDSTNFINVFTGQQSIEELLENAEKHNLILDEDDYVMDVMDRQLDPPDLYIRKDTDRENEEKTIMSSNNNKLFNLLMEETPKINDIIDIDDIDDEDKIIEIADRSFRNNNKNNHSNNQYDNKMGNSITAASNSIGELDLLAKQYEVESKESQLKIKEQTLESKELRLTDKETELNQREQELNTKEEEIDAKSWSNIGIKEEKDEVEISPYTGKDDAKIEADDEETKDDEETVFTNTSYNTREWKRRNAFNIPGGHVNKRALIMGGAVVIITSIIFATFLTMGTKIENFVKEKISENLLNNDGEGVPTNEEIAYSVKLDSDPNKVTENLIVLLGTHNITTLNLEEEAKQIIAGDKEAVEIRKSYSPKRLYLIGKTATNASNLVIETKSGKTITIFFKVLDNVEVGDFNGEIKVSTKAEEK